MKNTNLTYPQENQRSLSYGFPGHQKGGELADFAGQSQTATNLTSSFQSFESGYTNFSDVGALGNPFLDLNSYTEHLLSAKRLGIFTVGGGVPRNWAQQTPPYIEILNLRLGTELPPPRFQYGVRICPEPDYWGGLSGCTYQEGISWGKFIPPAEGGRFAEVLSDATEIGRAHV